MGLFICCCLAKTNHYQFIYDFYPGNTCFTFDERDQDLETRSVNVQCIKQHLMCTDYLCQCFCPKFKMNLESVPNTAGCTLAACVERLSHVMLLMSVLMYSCFVPYFCSGLYLYTCASVFFICLQWIHILASYQMYQNPFLFALFFSNVKSFLILISGLSRVLLCCCWHSYPKMYLSWTD